MKQKRAVLLLVVFLIVFSVFLISALTDEEKVEEAYGCLKEKVGDCSLPRTDQTAFSLIALAYDSDKQKDCLTNLNSLDHPSGNLTCWGEIGSSTCDLKHTAMSILALDYLGEDTEGAEDWLLDKKTRPQNVEWYLEIDINQNKIEEMNCDIEVNDAIESFTITEDRKVSGSSSCLIPSIQNYFLKINSGCYDSGFKISCDKDFLTTLLYKKSGDQTFYISSNTHTAQAYDITEETINSFCLGLGGSCDYEGTLWASLALDKTANDVSDLLPYLNIAKDEVTNTRYLPSSFLYLITGLDDFYLELTGKQRRETFSRGYWEVSGNKFYDSALGIYSLQGSSSEEKTKAIDYLLKYQDNSGCWNQDSITDTAFILFSGWPKNPADTPDDCEPDTCADLEYECGDWDDSCGNLINCGACDSGKYCDNGICINKTEDCEDECEEDELKCVGDYLKICKEYDEDICLDWSPTNHNDTIECEEECKNGKCVSGGTTTPTKDDCEDAGYFCLIPGDCSAGDTLNSKDFYCSWLSDVCCKKDVVEETCSQKSGKICASGEDCSVSEVSALDTNYCCLGDCEEASDQENPCEAKNYNCRISCRDGEEIQSYDCEFSSDVCCGSEDTKSNWLLIILLIILIILVILAIIFRNQLKIWFFRIKSKFRKGKGPGPTTRPGMPPPGPPRFIPRPRQIIPRGAPARESVRRPVPKTSNDSVFDNTMKKLKDMTR